MHIYIKELDQDNVNETYLQWMNNPKVNAFLESRWVIHTLESLEEFVIKMKNSDSNYLFGIFDKQNNAHIGNIKLGPIHSIYKYASIGLFIGDEKYWGKGVGSKAIELVTDFAFNDLKLNKVTAGMYSENVASFKAFSKNNFIQVGLFKKHVLVEEKYQDVIRIEKINGE